MALTPRVKIASPRRTSPAATMVLKLCGWHQKVILSSCRAGHEGEYKPRVHSLDRVRRGTRLLRHVCVDKSSHVRLRRQHACCHLKHACLHPSQHICAPITKLIRGTQYKSTCCRFCGMLCCTKREDASWLTRVTTCDSAWVEGAH